MIELLTAVCCMSPLFALIMIMLHFLPRPVYLKHKGM